jgi:hypothetical protein
VGARIAERLDELAGSVSSEVSLIAASAESSVAAVLTGDRSAEVVSEVSAACTAVIRAVQEKVATLAELAAELEPLTAPAVQLS